MTINHVKSLLSRKDFDPFGNEVHKALLIDTFDASMQQLRRSRLCFQAQHEIDRIDARLEGIRAEQKCAKWCSNPLATNDERKRLHRRRSLLTTSVALSSRS